MAVSAAGRGLASQPRYLAGDPVAAASLTGLPRWMIGPADRPGWCTSRSAWTCLITNAPDGHHDFRPLRILLDLGAQSLDVHVDQPGVGRVPVAPDLLE